jgi:hypothetical protein
MNSKILKQLALNTNLLPDEISKAILDGTPPRVDEIIFNLVVHSLDCWAMTDGDPKSTWTERRLSRQALVVTFLLALNRK